MGKSKKNRASATKQIQLKSQTTAEAFSFGDPVPVWTAENCWTMWNAYRQIAGMSRQ
ncbi:capsid portal protein [Escherichia coli]|nr:capsid portal protein [Escherichia coli]